VGVAPRLVADPRIYLRAIEVFAHLTEDETEAVMSCIRWRVLGQGEVLFREGSPGVTMMIIVEGSLSVYSTVADIRHEISREGVGHFVGEMACLDPSPRSATVVAATPAVVGEISRDGLHTLQSLSPRVSSLLVGAIIREVTKRLRDVDRRVDEALAPPQKRTSSQPPPSGDASGMRKLLDWLLGQR
jgi:CRP-like cAMP-binding protein